MAKDTHPAEAISNAVRIGAGFELARCDTAATPGFTGGKKAAAKVLASGAEELSELQERLYANGRDGSGPSVLLIIQGMDTSGKGGIMRHVVGQVDPQGVKTHRLQGADR